jgi:hypothetical protein
MATARTWRCYVGDSPLGLLRPLAPCPTQRTVLQGRFRQVVPSSSRPPRPSRAPVDTVLGEQQVHCFLAECLRRSLGIEGKLTKLLPG